MLRAGDVAALATVTGCAYSNRSPSIEKSRRPRDVRPTGHRRYDAPFGDLGLILDGAVTNENSLKIILIRHGRPALAVSPRTTSGGFRKYIDAYEQAGLDPKDLPSEELKELVRELGRVFSSGRRRADESARALAPDAELIVDPLFVEAPLASPRFPLLRMKVTKWAVMARILWHAGYHPEIENYRRAKHRAAAATDILVAQARQYKSAALVAHGYFNFLIGRELLRRGFRQSGSHRAKFWNAVVYRGPDRPS